MILSNNTTEKLLDFRKNIYYSINIQLSEYSFLKSDINHLILTIIPYSLNLITKYKVDTSNRKDTRKFIEENFSSKTIIPKTVNPELLGGELRKTVLDGKIVDLVYFKVRDNDYP